MKILAIDGNSILNRAFYGIHLLTNSKGVYTNALTGFMNIFLKEKEIVKPDGIVVAFDLKAPTFRHKKVETYKANRKGMPPELRQQMPLIKEILTDLGIKIIEAEGFEADDILGTVSRICAETKNECYILTGDRDSLQLVNDYVTVRLATTKETIVYTPQKVNEVYGLEPLQLIELKALMGDSSDNISGVAGIGEKTALNLIKEYKSVENLYAKIDEAKLTDSVRKKLKNGYDDAIQSHWLGTIVKNAPIEENIESFLPKKLQTEKLKNLLSELEMFRLSSKLLSDDNTSNDEIKAVEKEPVPDYKISELTEEKLKSVTKSNVSYFIFKGSNLKINIGTDIYLTDNKNLILDYFNDNCEKKTFDAKNAYKFAFANNTELKNITFCCDLAGYLLNSQASDYTAENLCSSYKVRYLKSLNENADIACLSALCSGLLTEIKDTEMEKLLFEIEMPLCEVLASMETDGIKLNSDGVRDFGLTLTEQLKKLEQEIYSYSGKEFNITSPKQLGVILFEELALPAKKKTKSGYSTNADVLESLMDKHPIIPLIVEYRTLSKLKSTYVDGLLKEVKSDGRVHSIFKQTETRTGRISSTEPNMQNIPVRKEIGRNMRKFFVAKENYILLDADYSQIELRVLADMCGDEHMRSLFLENKDIHTSTASQVFGVPEAMVSSDMRRAAKAVNFGIVYGIGAFSLSKDIGVSVAEADRYIKGYLANYPQVGIFMEKTVADGIANGYVTTLFGRRRYIPELNSSNKMLQAFGKRAAMNAPIQGTAADIIKVAMIKVYHRLKEEKIDARLILQVHDELIVEASIKDKEKAAKILHDEMINAVKLSVPLIADVNEGDSWYDAKG